MQDKLQTLESVIKDYQNPLDSPITLKELQDKICSLKRTKACGVDGILNKMIKYTDLKFQLAILKLLNTVLSPGIFPNIWNRTDPQKVPIHKSGDKFYPDNYRGVCVNNNLGKILWMIINSRLLNFLTDNNAMRKKQKNKQIIIQRTIYSH